MRFLFECVGCCAPPSPAPAEDPASPTEETRSLVAPVARRRRKRPTARGQVAAEWRPSLFAISEDNAVASPAEGKAAAERRGTRAAPAVAVRPGGPRNVKRCGPASVRVTRSHDLSHDPLPLVVPAFSAAPFMF